MTTTAETYPMPDLHCPEWCERDHLADWQKHVAVGLETRSIPAAGGGFLPDNRGPLSEWLTTEYFLSSHLRTLAEVDLLEPREHAHVELACDNDGDGTYLYINAQGAMTAEQARKLAAELLNGADQLDGLGG